MSKTKPALHMSIQPEKGDILPPLQKRIVLYLSKNEPQTKNEIVLGMNGSQKSYWNAIERLKDKTLVQAVGSKTYRGNIFERIWISPTGVLVALFEGEDPKTLLENTIKVYPEDTNLQTIIEFAPILGTKAFEYAFHVILTKGRLDESDILMLILTQKENDMTTAQVKELLNLLKKHPQQLEDSKIFAKEITEKIQIINELLNEPDKIDLIKTKKIQSK